MCECYVSEHRSLLQAAVTPWTPPVLRSSNVPSSPNADINIQRSAELTVTSTVCSSYVVTVNKFTDAGTVWSELWLSSGRIFGCGSFPLHTGSSSALVWVCVQGPQLTCFFPPHLQDILFPAYLYKCGLFVSSTIHEPFLCTCCLQ